jgi:hypothetical protein
MLRNLTQYVCLMRALKTTAATVWIAAAGACFAADNRPKAEPDVTVLVKTDDQPGIVVLLPAEITTSAIFAKIGVRLVWAAEGGSSRAATGLVVRVHITDRPRAAREATLGFACPYADGIQPVTIMWDRVRSQCRDVARQAPVLLAHVMAHEVAHVLQGVSHHAADGLMKAQWTMGDLREMRWHPLPFTDADASLIRSGLARLRGLTLAEARGY